MARFQEAIQIRPGRDSKYSFGKMQVPRMFCGAVEIEVLLCGECPTWKAVAKKRYGMAPPGEDWLTLGHEIFGRISKIDDHIADYLQKMLYIGQKVMVSVRVPTPGATGLAATAPHLCSDSSKGWFEHGLYGAHGGYTRKMVVDARFVNPIPAGLPDQFAVLAEGGVCVQTAVDCGIAHQLTTLGRFQYPYPKVALVLGAGPASMMATIFYIMNGYTVVVVSRGFPDEPRAKRLIRLGARYFQAEDSSGFIDELKHSCGPFAQVFNGTGVAAARVWRRAVGDTGSFVEYSIPESSCVETVDLSVDMIHEVTTATCSVGSINCDPQLWHPTFIALQWALVKWPWLAEEQLFFEVPFNSKAPRAIVKAVEAGWFKPMVVMDQ